MSRRTETGPQSISDQLDERAKRLGRIFEDITVATAKKGTAFIVSSAIREAPLDLEILDEKSNSWEPFSVSSQDTFDRLPKRTLWLPEGSPYPDEISVIGYNIEVALPLPGSIIDARVYGKRGDYRIPLIQGLTTVSLNTLLPPYLEPVRRSDYERFGCDID